LGKDILEDAFHTLGIMFPTKFVANHLHPPRSYLFSELRAADCHFDFSSKALRVPRGKKYCSFPICKRFMHGGAA
jgi:hypothetical protein